MVPAMVPYLLHVGQWAYQEAQQFWKEVNRVVDRVEMVPPGRQISTAMNGFPPRRQAVLEKHDGVHRYGNDGFRRWMERKLYPHLGQQVDAYV